MAGSEIYLQLSKLQLLASGSTEQLRAKFKAELTTLFLGILTKFIPRTGYEHHSLNRFFQHDQTKASRITRMLQGKSVPSDEIWCGTIRPALQAGVASAGGDGYTVKLYEAILAIHQARMVFNDRSFLGRADSKTVNAYAVKVEEWRQLLQADEPADPAPGPMYVNWNDDHFAVYPNEEFLWWRQAKHGQKKFLPQAMIVFGVPGGPSDTHIAISCLMGQKTFDESAKVEEAVEHYEKTTSPFYNTTLLAGLVSWNSSPLQLQFQAVEYFDFLKTNLSIDRERKGLATLRRSVSARAGKLTPFEGNPLANAVGLNGLGFSSDRFLICQVRHGKLAMRPNQVCSAFSGFLDYADITGAIAERRELARLSDVIVLREMAEELGTRIHLNSDVVERRFLGITRELARGGMAEILYATKLCVTADEILSRRRRDEEGTRIAVYFGEFAKIGPTAHDTPVRLPLDRLIKPRPQQRCAAQTERPSGPHGGRRRAGRWP